MSRPYNFRVGQVVESLHCKSPDVWREAEIVWLADDIQSAGIRYLDTGYDYTQGYNSLRPSQREPRLTIRAADGLRAAPIEESEADWGFAEENGW